MQFTIVQAGEIDIASRGGGPGAAMIDFETAYGWLNKYHYSCLGASSRQLVSQLAENLRPAQPARLQSLLGHLLAMVDQVPYEDEQAECLLACARAEFRLNVAISAIRHLESAARLYSENHMLHQHAVALWLRGWVLWNQRQPQDYVAGLALLQESARLFEKLAAINIVVDWQARAWYRSASADMVRTIQQQMDMMDLHPGAAGDEAAPAAPIPAPASLWRLEYPAEEAPAAPGPPSSSPPEDVEPFPYTLQVFEITDWIPAGGRKAMNAARRPLGYMQLDRVIIDDRCYRVEPLRRNGTRINLTRYLNSGQQMVVLKVKGDSMNRTSIQDGDYVLVAMQDAAQDGDIVVAGVSGVDQEATLKYYRPRGSVVDLVPNSDNPAHSPQTYSLRGAGFFISGVALAVFKAVD